MMTNADTVSNQTDNNPEISNNPQPTENPSSQQDQPVEQSSKGQKQSPPNESDSNTQTPEPAKGSQPDEKVPSAPISEENADKTDEDTSKKEKSSNIPDKKEFDDVFRELIDLKQEGKTIEVEVKERIRGGLRVFYKEMPLFLPASHFNLRRNPPEEEMQQVVGQTINVHIHELQEDETNRKTVIVSRKRAVEEEFWSTITEGQVVEGTVSSIANFGVFLDLGGIEGLIHISRLSQVHVDDPKNFAKKGEKMKAKVVEVDHERKRIALSRKELEESPWKGVEEEFPPGTQTKGVVRRINEFGAYIELKPGVDGLLRTSELSWTRRLKSPAEILQRGQEIEIEVINADEEKQTAALSYKRTRPNPWTELKERFPVGEEAKAKVLQIVKQGAVVNVEGMVDGFMPKSKMYPIMKGKKIPFEVGHEIDVVVADIVPDEESIILAPKLDEEQLEAAKQANERQSGGKRGGGKKGGSHQPADSVYEGSSETLSEGSFSLGDLLSEKAKEKLLKGK